MKIRRAVPSDQAILVDYNRRMAWETERKRLDDQVLAAGVAAVFADPAKGFYLVAEREGDVVGQLMITPEWSDWRNGFFWWIQSVYVREDARRLGVFRTLYREIERLAQDAGNIIGIRLYVERDNRHAQQTYENLGMKQAGYLLYEALASLTGADYPLSNIDWHATCFSLPRGESLVTKERGQ